MQTFLPFPNIITSVHVLDWRRLGKQRVEAYQILRINLGITKECSWSKHPAVLMWKGYDDALKCYLNLCIKEWICRGRKNNMILEDFKSEFSFPPWFCDDELHKAHRSSLLFKGEVDAVVGAISLHFKEHYSKWNKMFDFPKYKNLIREDELRFLLSIARKHDLPFVNHYKQFNWKEAPKLISYWPKYNVL